LTEQGISVTLCCRWRKKSKFFELWKTEINLFVILLLAIITLGFGGLGLLSAVAAWPATTKWRGQSKVDVLLGVETNDEGRHIDDLLADTDMALADQNTSMVD
jgi:hypothetical protein